MNEEIIKNMQKHNKTLSKYACLDNKAIRLKEISNDFRTPFYRDIDKVIYSLSYIRYIDKTQVYSNTDNDMISKRMTHVQMVSKIARTIGRALNLNEDLIEAASLGHDLGHVPFGHAGEKILNELSIKYNEGYFYHNVQSVRTLLNIENHGHGSNVTLQVLDAIFCHNGESLLQKYEYKQKTKEEFLNEYNSCYKDKSILSKIKPMTLEGCVVRISDVIAYIGKDIDDAIRLEKIKEEDIPKNITDVLGLKNSDIVNTIVLDIINNSIGQNCIKLSDRIYNTLCDLIKFNYEFIYNKAISKEQLLNIKEMFNKLFDLYYNQIQNKEINEDIYINFYNQMNDNYKLNTTPARVVIDYVSGMTDDYFLSQYKKYFDNK